MDEQAKIVKKYNETKKNLKTEQEWNEFKTNTEWEQWMIDKQIPVDKRTKKLEQIKNNYLKYGSIYGKKYAVVTNYGDWDNNFTMELLEKFINHYFRVLKNAGTLILFFDIWKITPLKEMMEKVGFKQIRFIEWIKTNPQPLNSSTNYLTNCQEIALVGVKNLNLFLTVNMISIYKFHYKVENLDHPTQKSLLLFEELIKKHSNENDVVLDTFLGSGTTAKACKNTNRNFKGCEVLKEYYEKTLENLNS